MTMGCRFGGGFIVQSTGWNDHPLAISRRMRHGAKAAGTDLPREALGFRQVVTRDQLLSLELTKLIDRHRNIGRFHASGRFPAS